MKNNISGSASLLVKGSELHTVETDTDLVSEDECDITKWTTFNEAMHVCGKELCYVDNWLCLLDHGLLWIEEWFGSIFTLPEDQPAKSLPPDGHHASVSP